MFELCRNICKVFFFEYVVFGVLFVFVFWLGEEDVCVGCYVDDCFFEGEVY